MLLQGKFIIIKHVNKIFLFQSTIFVSVRDVSTETRTSQLNDTKFRSKIRDSKNSQDTIRETSLSSVIETQKLETRERLRGLCLHANALCLACSPPKRIPRCVSRCATKAQQVRAAHRKERTLERKPTPTIIFPFFSLSLTLFFFERRV